MTQNTMTQKLLFALTIALVAAGSLCAADATGKWTFDQPGRDGNAMNITLNLKADGNMLTGTISGMRGDTAISDGKIDGDNISFAVKREMPNGSFTITYKGTLDGDTLKLDVTRPGRDGGDPVTRTVTAKRATT